MLNRSPRVSPPWPARSRQSRILLRPNDLEPTLLPAAKRRGSVFKEREGISRLPRGVQSTIGEEEKGRLDVRAHRGVDNGVGKLRGRHA